MLGLILFVYKGFLVIFLVLQQIFFHNSKKNNKKKAFSQKKLFTAGKFEKCCEAKKMKKGHISGRRKNLKKN